MTTGRAPILVLFRNDLRISDNRALSSAVDAGRPVVPLFILDGDQPSSRRLGAASRWWLHHSLLALSNALEKLGSRLLIRQGSTDEIVAETVKSTGADAVFWNRRYSPSDIAADTVLKSALRADGLKAESFDGFLLHEPSQLSTRSGDFYKVFTPFYNRLSEIDARDPIDTPSRIEAWDGTLRSEKLGDLKLLPGKPDWSGGFADRWHPGEAGAKARLERFLEDCLDTYAEDRNVPGVEGTSGLSPHLARGEISPVQIMAALRRRRGKGADTYRKEIAWREFSYHLLFNRPKLHSENFRPDYDSFEWQSAPSALKAWQSGRTGYPIVDAGMRELWQTGWMHNRVRMITASFLVKDLLVDWRDGEGWFWDTLVDADPANNPASWQWVAGSGADAAPYFRIFNPILQGEKFDPEGAYVRRYVPELARLPNQYVHRPFEAPASLLAQCGVVLGENYPSPLVDHSAARERALKAYRRTRGS